MLHDLVQIILIFVAVVDCNGQPLCAKSTSPSNPVHIVFSVAHSVPVRHIHRWHIEVHNDLDFRDIDTSCKHVSGDDDIDFLSLKLSNHLITFFMAHVSENYGRLIFFFPHHFVQPFSVVLGVDKDDCLRHSATIEDLFDEFWFLSFLALVHKLLNVIQLQLFLFDVYLLCFYDYIANFFFDIFRVCGTEQDVLDLGLDFRDVL